MSASVELSRIEDWDLGDVCDFEEFSGMSFDALVSAANASQQRGQPVGFTMKAITVMMWIMKRKDDPAFTLQQARSIKLKDLQAELVPTSAVPTPMGRRTKAVHASN